MCRIPWAKRTLFCQSLLIGKGQVACVACVSLFRWNTLWWYWRWSEAQLQSGDFSSKAMPQNWQWKSKRSEKLFGFSPNPYFPNLIFQTIFTTEILTPVISGISADGKTRLHFFVLFTPLIKKKKKTTDSCLLDVPFTVQASHIKQLGENQHQSWFHVAVMVELLTSNKKNGTKNGSTYSLNPWCSWQNIVLSSYVTQPCTTVLLAHQSVSYCKIPPAAI